MKGKVNFIDLKPPTHKANLLQLAHKINLANNKEINTFLNKFYYSPNDYFNPFFNSRTFSIGRCMSASKNGSKSKIPQIPKNTLLNLSENDFNRTKSIHHITPTNGNKKLEIKSKLNESDVKTLFENLQSKQEDKIKKGFGMINNFSEEMNHCLTQQESSLKEFKKFDEQSNKISQYLQKKIIKKPSKLLMNLSGCVREQKEILDTLNYEIPDKKLWGKKLRDWSNPKKNFNINIDNREININPPKEMIKKSLFPSHSSFNLLRHNAYLIENYSNYVKSMIKNGKQLNDISIKGEKLLDFERKNAEKLKGKIILYQIKKSRNKFLGNSETIVEYNTKFPLIHAKLINFNKEKSII